MTIPLQPSAIMPAARILTISAIGDIAGDPKPSDFAESVSRYALVWGPRAARAYRKRMLASFKISRHLRRAAVATQAWRCALAHANGHVDVLEMCWRELVALVKSEADAISCVNCYRAAHIVRWHSNYRSLELRDIEAMLERKAAAA